jgi:tRNA G10  N-methylase Trm11
MGGQYFKTIYFSDHPAENSRAKSVTVAFGEKDHILFLGIKPMSNQEIRDLTGIQTYQQLLEISQNEDRTINNIIKRLIRQNIQKQPEIKARDVTFSGSKAIPFQRWYPYIEGYSIDYVKSLIEIYELRDIKTIYDPFAGTGTTIFGVDSFGINTVFSEINPLLQFIITTKLTILKSKDSVRVQLADKISGLSMNMQQIINGHQPDKRLYQSYHAIFNKSIYFDEETFDMVLRSRAYIDTLRLTDALMANVVEIAVLSGLIPISRLKKSGDVRYKTEKELTNEKITFADFITKKLDEMAEDIRNMQFSFSGNAELIIDNARKINFVRNIKIDAVITSPPYLNGTNYFRNTKLELWFLRYIQHEDDIRLLRDQALTSGINDVNRNNKKIAADDNIIFKSALLKNALNELNNVAYDKRIPIMAFDYFNEMYTVFTRLAPLLGKKAKIIIDIGDSIFAGVHISTDDILIELFNENYLFLEKKEVRKRRSRNKTLLRQSLLVFQAGDNHCDSIQSTDYYGKKTWNAFKRELPHQKLPFSKKTWGHPNHSLCSYQGKLKPSIAYHLVKTFIPENGIMLDPFAGVGTIPFEAALNGIQSFGIDISVPAYYIAQAKVGCNNKQMSIDYLHQMDIFIKNNVCSQNELEEAEQFGFNKTLVEYYETNTLHEIILARRFLKENPPKNSSEMLVIASLLHILHGNRPYALSRRSHPIVPYAPRGEFEYKNLIKKTLSKAEKAFTVEFPAAFKQGKIFCQDSTSVWPQKINNLDAVITSPPFFDSTRFYLANWIRLWFAGWTAQDFKLQINSFVEEKQKEDFSIYKSIFRQTRERLKKDGVLVLHLGKSKKCDMAVELQNISKYWFKTADIFNESVVHCESHGIRDKGTVTSHQYLILT